MIISQILANVKINLKLNSLHGELYNTASAKTFLLKTSDLTVCKYEVTVEQDRGLGNAAGGKCKKIMEDLIIMKNLKTIFRILFEHIILRLSDNRGSAPMPDFGKFYRDENGILFYENENKIFKITSRYIEKVKDDVPTLSERITNLINSELIR